MKMKEMRGPALLVLVLWTVAAGCSVKEDRSDCPCYLDISLSGGAERSVTLTVWRDTSLWGRDAALLEEGRARREVRIPRGRLDVAACSGVHACTWRGAVLKTGPGSQMDEVYAVSETVDARGDEAKTELPLHKHFARLHLGVVGTDAGDYPFRIVVQGSVCGLHFPGLEPVPGPFSVTLLPVVGTYHRVVLPRQHPSDALSLVFYDREAGPDAEPRARYSLDAMLLRAGYDWEQADLDDIYLDIDHAEADVTVRILDWEKEQL